MLKLLSSTVRHHAGRLGLERPRKGEVRKSEIRRYLPDGPTVVEAGAHIGLDTVAMARWWKGSRIHSFEPVPTLYRELVKNVREHDNVSTYQLAIAGKSGDMTMNVSGGRSDGSSSILEPLEHLRIHPDVTFDDTISVRATTLDDWASEHVVSPDLLWLDAQGAELQILQGGVSTLRHASAIYTEVSVAQNYSGGVLYPELVSWLGGHGFVPVIERIAWADGGNVLFARM